MTIVLKDILISPTATNTITHNSLTMSNIVAGTTDSQTLIDNPTTSSEVRVFFDDILTGITSVGSLKSQSGQTDYSTSVGVSGLIGTKTLITVAGSILDTDTATDGATSTVATAGRTTTTSNLNQAMTFNNLSVQNSISSNVNGTFSNSSVKYLDGSNDIESKITSQAGQATLSTISSNVATGEFCSLIDIVGPTAIVSNHTYNSDTSAPPAVDSSYFTQINATNARGGYTYNDNTPSANITNSVDSFTDVSTASHTLTSLSASGASIHSLKMETPVSGNASIAHTVTGASRNLALTTTGDLLITSDNFNVASASMTIPAIGQPVTAQITQDGLTMLDSLNLWKSWYRKSSAYVSNFSDTIIPLF